jgi:vacuolar-type H+-ATPase subunit I/STV1
LGQVSQRFNSELLPPPLRSALDHSGGALTVSGVINFTNQQREANGLLSLRENQRLNAAAEAKVQDMFDKQYFEHESPEGRGPSDLANDAGYKYVLVGENLALGNFKDDQALVEAWMNSPGHRANILQKRYQEIGVAVGKGMFEGKEVWLAVQEFGTPLSSCPQPPESMKAQINSHQSQIDQLQRDLELRKAELENNDYDRQTYNKKVDEYNDKVREVNALIAFTKQLVEQYNAAISQFNKCLEG